MRQVERLTPVLLLLCCCVGCHVMMYPFARAFGGAKESELEVSRQAFAAMKTEIRGGSVVVFPTLVTNLGAQQLWDTDGANGAAEFLRRELSASTSPTSEIPGVPFEPIGGNELRYETHRGRTYAAWVGSRHPAGDRFVFTEVVRDAAGGTILGGLVFVVDASGRIAYSRHYDSHWFDPASMPSVDVFLEWMLKEFLEDLGKEPTEIFPPYGVG